QRGGVLVRAGHTEAGCDLAQLAGLTPAAVICEILKDDGEMARLPDLLVFAQQHGLKVGTIADLIHYRSRTESLVRRMLQRPLQTVHGRFVLHAYQDVAAGEVHLALVRGEIRPDKEVLVRVHEPFSALDLMDVESMQHSWNLNEAMRRLVDVDAGVIVLLHRNETGEGLLHRLTHPSDAPPSKMDLRTYGIGAQILRDLGVAKMRIMGVPRKMPSMAGFDLEVTGYLLPDRGQAAVVTPIAERRR